MSRIIKKIKLGFALAFGLAMTSTSSLVAQESTPPVIPETAILGAPQISPLSDRALIAPNMYGDVFGTRPFLISGPGLAGGVGLGGGAGTPGTPGTTRQLSAILRATLPAPSNTTFAGTPGSPTLTLFSLNMNFLGTPLPNSNFTATTNVVFPGQPTLQLFENPAVSAAIKASFQKPGETTVYNATLSQAQKTPIVTTFSIYNVFLVYDFTTPGIPGIPASNITLLVPNPADGGLAGRNRVSTDSSPLPRDRFIFNYDYVSSDALYSGGPNMNRFVIGFEKTFLDGLASIEMRLPFASTVNSTSNSDATFGSGHMELGNLFIVLKALLYSTDTIAVSSGLGISVPTADDVRLQLGGPDVLKIQNEAIILTPFVAALWTPSDRVFAQTWVGFGFDTTGNSVLTNLDGNGLNGVGKLYDPCNLQVDLQLGYWLIHPRDGNGFVRGLAPFAEFHFNSQLQSQNSAASGPFTLTPSVGQLTEYSMSTGFTTQIGSNVNLMVGATFPLSNQQSRFSDWSVGLRLNYFFGPTGRARASAF